MNKSIQCILAGALAAAIAVPAAAYQRDPGVNKRQQRQGERIHQGVKSGELTKKEARQLRAEEKSVRKEEKAFKSDGKLTRNERKQLHKDLNKTSRDIYSEKHDAEKRTGGKQ